jgi:hypothetical protein
VTLPWWGWLAFVGLVLAGVGLVFAPVLGALWAQRDMPMPEDRPSETIRSLRALYWRYIRGRRSP